MNEERRRPGGWPGGVPPPHDPDYIEPPEVSRAVIRRIKRIAVFAWLVFAVFSWIWAGFHGFLGLTCSAAVTMIAFLWLEEIAEALLQPAAHRRNARRLALRAIGRFFLLGVALLVTITVARFNAVSMLLGFSIIVVGILGEALHSLAHR
ncbi:MAG TPA: ATP synthase subunit I [Thermoanaerobaculia bacterium]|nr:ATP synthase subunit I [Thermoanaerobaculia bacterium]